MSISEEDGDGEGADEMDPTSDNEADFTAGSGEGGKVICFSCESLHEIGFDKCRCCFLSLTISFSFSNQAMSLGNQKTKGRTNRERIQPLSRRPDRVSS